MSLTINGSGGGITREEVVSLTGWNVLAQTPINYTKTTRFEEVKTWSSFIDFDVINDYNEFRFRLVVDKLDFKETSGYSDRYNTLEVFKYGTNYSSDPSDRLKYCLFYLPGNSTTTNWSGELTCAPFGKVLRSMADGNAKYAFRFYDIPRTYGVLLPASQYLVLFMNAADATCTIKGTLYFEGRK